MPASVLQYYFAVFFPPNGEEIWGRGHLASGHCSVIQCSGTKRWVKESQKVSQPEQVKDFFNDVLDHSSERKVL
jgi:hypothetical protein